MVVADEIGKLAITSAQTAQQIQVVSKEVIQAVNELAQKSEQMLAFMEEVAIQGYEKLLSTSQDYQNDVSKMNAVMHEFAVESAKSMKHIERIKTATSLVDAATLECAQDITRVTETMVALTKSVGDVNQAAEINKKVASELHLEVNKFKLE